MLPAAIFLPDGGKNPGAAAKAAPALRPHRPRIPTGAAAAAQPPADTAASPPRLPAADTAGARRRLPGSGPTGPPAGTCRRTPRRRHGSAPAACAAAPAAGRIPGPRRLPGPPPAGGEGRSILLSSLRLLFQGASLQLLFQHLDVHLCVQKFPRHQLGELPLKGLVQNGEHALCFALDL